MKKLQLSVVLCIILISGSFCLTQMPQALAEEGSIATYELSFAQTTFDVAMPNNYP